ncbi:helix-turn-helix domain-containing protein [Streptomyces gardneri]|uniref:helix-turn-helix domain-containing protein n=1 Tax=Streptomyces gardneri TaxID=66892 RepID=UPI0033E7FD32
MTQEQLAEAAGVSVGVVRKLERGGTASLPSLLSIADSLGTDIAVLLGRQAPRRSMDRDERAALRMVSAATHDAAIGIPAEVEPGHRRRAPCRRPSCGRCLLGRPVHRARHPPGPTAPRGASQVRRLGHGRARGRRRSPDRHLPDRGHGRQRARFP